MADHAQETIRLLSLIEKNTAKHTGEASKKIGSIGNSESSKDKMEESAKDLTKSYEQLNKAIDENKKALDAAAKSSKDRVKADDELNKRVEALRKNIDDQVKAGDNLNSIKRKNAEELSALSERGVDFSSVLNDTSLEMNKLSNGINEHYIALQKITEEEKEYAKTIQELDDVTKKHLKLQDEVYKENVDNVEGHLKALGASLLTFAALMDNVLSEVQASGFESGGIGGLGSLMGASVLMGVSPAEVTRFAAQNRDIITSITNSASLSAEDSAHAIESYGEVVKDTFGVVGEKQLEMVGQGLKALTNLGIPATMDNFEELNQSVENMAKTSNMTADEIYAEFSNLAEDSGFQGIIHTLGSTTNVATMLQESFSYLQGAVGANAEEFIKYQRHLADQRKRAGVERVVQARFAEELAAEVGMSQEQIALIGRGTGYRQSLSTEDGPDGGPSEQKRFDELLFNLQSMVGEERSKAIRQGEGGTAMLERLRVLMEGSNVEENVSRANRRRAGVTGAVADAQGERLKASEKQTDAILQYASELRELTAGLAKSPLFQSGVLGALVTASVFAGVKAGMTRGLAKGLVDAGIGRSASVKGTATTAASTAGTGAATNTGKIASKLGTLGKVAGKIALPISAAIGAFTGFNAAMKQEGDALEKTLAGVSEGVSAITFGASDWIADQIGGWDAMMGNEAPDKENNRSLGESIFNFIDSLGDLSGEQIRARQDRQTELMLERQQQIEEKRAEIENNKDTMSEEQLATAQEELVTLRNIYDRLSTAEPDDPILAPQSGTKRKQWRNKGGSL